MIHAADEPETVTVPPTTYLSISGEGPPGTPEFYAKKGAIRKAAAHLGLAGPIEIIYWFDPEHGEVGIARFYWTVELSHLHYRVLLEVPDGTALPAPADTGELAEAFGFGVEILTLNEGEVVQVMHHGPFANEEETLARLGAFADSRGLRRSGPHHEIHLDDFGPSTPQDALRTILRDPVVPMTNTH